MLIEPNKHVGQTASVSQMQTERSEKLNSYVKKKIEEHALECYPEECCGVIVNNNGNTAKAGVAKAGGKPKFIPTKNTSATPRQSFRIAAEDYAELEDKYNIIGIVHSHINIPATPSEGDRVACEALGMPWWIVSVYNNEIKDWYYFEPEGWEAPLVGRTFHHGVLDCYTLIRDFYKREMNIELLDFNRGDSWWDKGEDLYEDNFEKAGFVEVSDLQHGDVILMQYRANVINHGGIYITKPLQSQSDLFDMGATPLLLHHPMPRLSERVVYGGYWKEITRKIVRYVS